MSTKAYYTQEPEAIQYMALPTGYADVWLRQDIQQEETEDGTVWTAEEVYFRTSLSEEEVTENFDTLFSNGGPEVDEDTGEEAVTIEYTLAERVEILEEAFAEFVEEVLA